MSDLRISFIIPCYNAEYYIQDCIESIKPHVKYELVVVNDGSTDGTSKKLHELKERYDNLVLLEKENEGVNAARRDGWKVASGEYVCFVDADDTIDSASGIWKWLDKSYDVLKAGGYYVDGEKHELYTNPYMGEIRDAEHAYNLILNSRLLPFIHSSIYRRTIIDEDCFKIDPRFKIGEDLLFNIKLMGKAKKMRSVEESFYYYRMNGSSVMHTKVWGFHYIQAFNDELGRLIMAFAPSFEEKLTIHRFLDYTGTLMFPEVKYKHEYYMEIQSLLQACPWVKTYAPRKNVRFIDCECCYRIYLYVFRFIQVIRGKGGRKLID